jgi:hypothetical protein
VRRIFGPTKEKMAADCRRLHNEKLHKLNASANTITAIKLRTIKWAGYVVSVGQIMDTRSFLVNIKKRSLRRLGADGKVTLEWIISYVR